jgi:[NiFe] hydrogenase assembly HybE family chaperone
MTDPAGAVGARLAAFYLIVAPTMRDLPIYNPRLDVQAVGFRAHQDQAVGILVTPWFMNVVVAPLDGGPPLPPGRFGDVRPLHLPGGTIELIIGGVDGIGRLDSVSLFSPMASFDDPMVTLATAQAAMAALFDADLAESADLVAARPPVPRGRRAVLFGLGGGAA